MWPLWDAGKWTSVDGLLVRSTLALLLMSLMFRLGLIWLCGILTNASTIGSSLWKWKFPPQTDGVFCSYYQLPWITNVSRMLFSCMEGAPRGKYTSWGVVILGLQPLKQISGLIHLHYCHDYCIFSGGPDCHKTVTIVKGALSSALRSPELPSYLGKMTER